MEGNKRAQGNSHRTYEEHSSQGVYCSFGTGLERWKGPNLRRYSTLAWTGPKQHYPALEQALLQTEAAWDAPGVLLSPIPLLYLHSSLASSHMGERWQLPNPCTPEGSKQES